MRVRRAIGWAVIAVVAVGWAWKRPDRALGVASGLTAHNLCAAVFTQHLDPDATFRELVKPMSGGAGPLLRYRVDRPDRAVSASVLGLFGARAVWTEGYGCRLVFDPKYTSPASVAPDPPSPPDGFAPATAVAPPADLQTAFDTEFTDAPGVMPRHVKAVLIVKDGKVMAERYAPGFGIDTPPA